MKPADNDWMLNDPAVDMEFARKARAVLRDVRSKRPGLAIVQVLRTEATQRMYYCQGRGVRALKAAGFGLAEIARARIKGYLASKPIITKTAVTRYHGAGLAMDCAWVVNGRLRWDVGLDNWKLYAHAGAAHGLHSLGPAMGDWGHLQLGGD